MKKTKLIALLIFVTMILLSIPVSANYDPTTPTVNLPTDEWTLSTVYHWVVRGETLEGIAARYGTNVAEIKFYNQEYFNDLERRNLTLFGSKVNKADLCDTSMSLDCCGITLENGIRLKIYDQVTVKHYVERGDTLEWLANGGLGNGSFVLLTTPDAIIAQNYTWFKSLADLNKTRGTNNELEESYAMWKIWYIPYGAEGLEGAEFSDIYGTPLYISVPVQIKLGVDAAGVYGALADPKLPAVGPGTFPNQWYLRDNHYYMANDSELVGNGSPLSDNSSLVASVYELKQWEWADGMGPQVTFAKSFNTNSGLPNMYIEDPNTGAIIGWAEWRMGAIYGMSNHWIVNYKILGFYGRLAECLTCVEGNGSTTGDGSWWDGWTINLQCCQATPCNP